MANYRIYCLDGADKIASAGWLEAEDDKQAIALASEQYSGLKCEIWDGRRLIARVDLRREA